MGARCSESPVMYRDCAVKLISVSEYRMEYYELQ